MRAKRLSAQTLTIFCGLFLLLGVYLLFRQDSATILNDHSMRTKVPIVLYEEKRSLPPGSWQAISVKIPYKGFLEIDIEVEKGNPIDVIFIDGNAVNLLRNNGWNRVKGNPQFTANRTQKVSSIC
jgi:hypothetical protein